LELIRVLGNILVIIEKKDGKYFDLKKIIRKSGIDLENMKIDIIFYGSTDKEIIDKRCKDFTNVKKIDMEKIIIDTKYIERLNIKAQNITNDYFKSLEKNALTDTRKTLYASIFNTVLGSLKTRERLLHVIGEKTYNSYILIGKRKSKPFQENGLNILEKLKYFSELSAWTRILVTQQKKRIKVYKTDNFFAKNASEILTTIAFTIGYTKKVFSYYSVTVNKNIEKPNKVAVLLRGKVHANIATRLLENDKRNITFIFDSNRVQIDYLKYLFPMISQDLKPKRVISSKIIFKFIKNYLLCYKVIRQIGKESKKKELGGRLDFINCILTNPVMSTIQKHIKMNNINEYITFEETNLFGSIFSRAIVPIVKKSCCVQHGFTVSYYKTMPLISKERWVWGEHFKEQYILRGENEKRIDVRGKSILRVRNYQGLNEVTRLKVLVACGYSEDVMNLEKWVVGVLKALNNLCLKEINVSLHPLNETFIESIKNKIINLSSKVEVRISCTEQQIENSDIVVSGDTTVGFEAALIGKVVFFYSSNDEEIKYEYVHEPYIKRLQETDDIDKILKTISYEEEMINQLAFVERFAGQTATKINKK